METARAIFEAVANSPLFGFLIRLVSTYFPGFNVDKLDDDDAVDEIAPMESGMQQVRNHIYSKAQSMGGVANRKAQLFGARYEQNPGSFNDWMFLLTPEKLYVWDATVDPGLKYTHKPLNVQGCAHLSTGFYKDCWVFGKHRGKYPALVQRGGPVKVWRDKNKDFRPNDGIVEVGYFGINYHHAYDEIEVIGGHSAGCQVTPYKKVLAATLKLLKKSGLRKFSYMLDYGRNYDMDLLMKNATFITQEGGKVVYREALNLSY